MERPLEILRHYVKGEGLRNTPEREIILRAMYDMKSHFDVEELFLSLRKTWPEKRIAKASIYRNVNHFIAAGLIHETVSQDGRARYECNLGITHHDHMRCVRCNRIIEFHNEHIEKLQEDVCKRYGVEMVWHRLEIGVVCKKCNKSS